MFEVVGLKKVDYVNKEGRSINGTTFFCVYESYGVDGFAVLEQYCSNDKIVGDINLHDQIYIFYTRDGKVQRVEKINN